MSASHKPPAAPLPGPGIPKRPSAARAAPLFELSAPAAAPAARPSGPRPAPVSGPSARPSGSRSAVPPGLMPAAHRPPGRTTVPLAAPQMKRRRRRSAWPFYVAMGLILLALPAGYFLLLQDAPPASQELALPGKPVELKVTSVDGTVEIRRAGGEWGQVQAGQTLQASDGVRTGERGKATLSGGDQYEVQLEAQTEVAVDELTDSISRVMLGGGMATAKVQGGGKHVFEVHARNSDAVARTRKGTFAISNNLEGTVAVGTREGEVEFAGRGKTVIVRAGQGSVVLPGQAPSDPTTLPTSLLLKVDWPGEKILRKADITVAGLSEPGALVTVQGRTAVVDSEGKFRVKVKVKEGKIPLRVEARSVSGQEQRAEQEIRVDTRAPQVKVDAPPW